MADATLVQAIARAAAQTGASAPWLLATALQENGGTWGSLQGPSGLGDYVAGKPTSFGPFQFHEGGALGSNPPSWAFTYAAVLNRAQAFARARVSSGAGAAAVQGPAHPAAYAASVAARLPEAERLLGTVSASGAQRTDPGQAVALIAQTQDGVPYALGGGTLAGVSRGSNGTVGFDCSGLLVWAYGQLGIQLPHLAAAQFRLGVPVPQSQLAPGDAVFFAGADGTTTDPGHVGIYVGGGKFVAAPHTGASVAVFDLAGMPGYAGARRFVSANATQRAGAIVAATAGRTVPADASSLSSNLKAAVKTLLPHSSSVVGLATSLPGQIAGLPGDLAGAAGDAASSAAGAVAGPVEQAISGATSAITGEVESLVGRAEHAFLWLILVGFAGVIVYTGAKRAVAPNGTAAPSGKPAPSAGGPPAPPAAAAALARKVPVE